MVEIRGAVYLNGEFLPWGEARIPVFDHGFLYGDGAFDSLVVHKRRVFALDEHIDRFYDSVRVLRIKIPMDKKQLRAIILETIKRSGLKEAYVRLLLTRGVGYPLMFAPCKQATIMVAVQEISEIVKKGQGKGVKAKTVSIRKIPPICLDSRVKALPYIASILARMEAMEAGADEALLLDIHGFVAEGAGENIFAVKGVCLRTPPAINVLNGITRKTTIELAEKASYGVLETTMTLYDLYTANEAFFTSTWMGIVPIIEIDGRTVGDGKVGSITKTLMKLYSKVLEEEGTPIS